MVQPAIHPHVITFDAGQTLVDLDLDFLARRVGERGFMASVPALAAATPGAWSLYDRLVDQGADHVSAWKQLVGTVLAGAGISQPELVDWLYAQNRAANLWRKPIAGMVALARELAAAGAIVGVLSNSEGGLAALLEEVGIADPFRHIVDSGKLGIEKPSRAIFEHTLAALDARGLPAIHIGDSWNADIVGARGAGWRAIWYGRRVAPVADPEVAIARDAAETRTALARWGLL